MFSDGLVHMKNIKETQTFQLNKKTNMIRLSLLSFTLLIHGMVCLASHNKMVSEVKTEVIRELESKFQQLEMKLDFILVVSIEALQFSAYVSEGKTSMLT